MKLKIERVKYPSGTWYYEIYQKVFFFFWYRRVGFFDTLEEAEKDAVRILEGEKEERKCKKENPVYYRLEGNTISYNKGDGNERGIMGEPPLKLKKSS